MATPKPAKKTAAPAAAILTEKKPFEIKRPWLWLTLAVLLLYFPTLQLDFTELDDSIFIKEMHAYNEDMGNFFVSFGRGLFHPTNDDYYRPFFANIMLLNYQLSGENIEGYHLVNILLHLGSVLLLYSLLRKLAIAELPSFLLALIFAVHPVLSSSVTWIPGRNDLLLALFLFPFFTHSIDYAKTGKPLSLVWAGLLLVCGLLTKETAVFAAPAAFILVLGFTKEKLFEKRSLMLYGCWAAALAVYFLMRHFATLKHSNLQPSQMIGDFINRLPVLIQYLGKIFLPFNLSVFPIIEDTSYIYGTIAAVVLVASIVLAKEKDGRKIVAGLMFFFLMLLPALIVPNKLNVQTFEHRLYVPIIGILMILPQTIFFQNKLNAARLAAIFIGAAAVFAILNNRHQKNFSNPLSFWTQAYETSPHSSYAVMMYAARLGKTDQAESYRLMREAYKLNPDEKYLNYYYGVMLENQDSVLQSEPYFLKENKISDYYEVDFHLAHVAITKGDTIGAQRYMERYVSRDSLNPMGNNNLLVIYLQRKDKEKAGQQINAMQRRGIPVASDAIKAQQAL